MEFQLTEDERLIRDTARQVAREVIAPRASDIDWTSQFPHDNVKQLAELGFLGMMVPEEYGGAGLSTVAYVLAMEEISAACASTGVIMSVNNSLVCHPIEVFGNDEQKKKYLPAAGGRRVARRLLPDRAGQPAATPRARRPPRCGEGDDWVLNGTKNFITNGGVADIYIVYAMTDPAQSHKGISAFLVEADQARPHPRPQGKDHGHPRLLTCQIVLRPTARCRPRTSSGRKATASRSPWTRSTAAGSASPPRRVGIARAALERPRSSTPRSASRSASRSAEFQAIQWMMADMATELEAARLLTWQAAAA